jgi:hypothetical protein
MDLLNKSCPERPIAPMWDQNRHPSWRRRRNVNLRVRQNSFWPTLLHSNSPNHTSPLRALVRQRVRRRRDDNLDKRARSVRELRVPHVRPQNVRRALVALKARVHLRQKQNVGRR